VAVRRPEAASHSPAVPSRQPAARSRPSGANASDHTTSVWPVRVDHRPVAVSHSSTVPSSPVARVPPSGDNAIDRTEPVRPGAGGRLPPAGDPKAKAVVCRPVAASHSRTVPSSPAVASSPPPGVNATDNTAPVWPARVARGPVAPGCSASAPRGPTGTGPAVERPAAARRWPTQRGDGMPPPSTSSN
jgi:hypothetical protein